jgi:hypothetical protein
MGVKQPVRSAPAAFYLWSFFTLLTFYSPAAFLVQTQKRADTRPLFFTGFMKKRQPHRLRPASIIPSSKMPDWS